MNTEELHNEIYWLEKENKELKLKLLQSSLQLPTNKQILSEYAKVIKEEHKGLDDLEKEYLKLGFLYCYRFIYKSQK